MNFGLTNVELSDVVDENELAKQKLIFRRDFSKWRNLYKRLLIEGKTDSPLFHILSAFWNSFWIPLFRRERFTMGDSLWPNGICIPGLRRIFVSTSGNFFICDKMGESGKIGDAFTGFDRSAIGKIINGYIEISEQDSAKCWAVRICGACYVLARVGNLLERYFKQRAYCMGQRKMLEAVMKDYCSVLEKNPGPANEYFNKIAIT